MSRNQTAELVKYATGVFVYKIKTMFQRVASVFYSKFTDFECFLFFYFFWQTKASFAYWVIPQFEVMYKQAIAILLGLFIE